MFSINKLANLRDYDKFCNNFYCKWLIWKIVTMYFRYFYTDNFITTHIQLLQKPHLYLHCFNTHLWILKFVILKLLQILPASTIKKYLISFKCVMDNWSKVNIFSCIVSKHATEEKCYTMVPFYVHNIYRYRL